MIVAKVKRVKEETHTLMDLGDCREAIENLEDIKEKISNTKRLDKKELVKTIESTIKNLENSEGYL